MNSRDIIIICATAIILLAIGIFIMANPFGGAGETAILTMESKQQLNEGDSLILKLSDENKTAISGERIEINLTHGSNGVTENFTLKTNENGECRLEDLIADNFTLSAKFNGNKDYKPAMITGTIYVKKKANPSSQTSRSDKYKTANKVDDVIDGWDPKEHEVSREDLGDGTYRITYDDGYFRIVDEDGNILTYGY
ncbi:MAG: carboxypeptidase-like regulatory domain-containing protein [Methanobrevibacter ruminantium]|uniref:carboxypeptidase-like regulatory domain-containing protein n=1 Tax=Methanobrevibacter ruminantium TaxID=83816 RepID=UPI0026EA4C15|nr:carboxypeptidase-like regulatory domain-containing protein [Methanobrevibacter ruminantium]MDO5841983.1 carboxypeptidase-like regulatory domain-containing protein [Methanobrevibacter ruminantium]